MYETKGIGNKTTLRRLRRKKKKASSRVAVIPMTRKGIHMLIVRIKKKMHAKVLKTGRTKMKVEELL